MYFLINLEMNIIKIFQISNKKQLKLDPKLVIILASRFNTSARTTSEISPKLNLFVPTSQNLDDENFTKINDFILKSKKLFVLSGAGLSTESGTILHS